MADTGKSKFALATEVNMFGEMQGKKAPKWLFFAPSGAAKIKPIKFKRSMLLDSRKWKMKDLVDGCYAVARYDIAIFSTHISSVEKKLLENCNKLLKAKHKKLDEVTGIKDAKKNKDLLKLFKAAGDDINATFEKCAKSIEDKVSLALDEVESDKGDNKKALKNGKNALRKFFGANFKGVFTGPMTTAGAALKNLSSDLKANKKAEDSLDAALKKLKEAESDFEKNAGKVTDACTAVMDLGESMAGDKNADPSMRELGKTIDDGTEAAKALEKITNNIEDLGENLDKYRNIVSKALKSDDDEKVMKSVADFASKTGNELTTKAATYMKPVSTASTKLKKFQSEFNKLEKELKK